MTDFILAQGSRWRDTSPARTAPGRATRAIDLAGYSGNPAPRPDVHERPMPVSPYLSDPRGLPRLPAGIADPV